MKTLVIYPGRFHPFHRGHYASYQFLTDKFGADNVYVATSGKQAPVTSPFSFADKRLMMSKLGIPTGRIAQVTNPYRAEEITRDFDPNDTVLVFAISDKDAERISFAPRRDGSPSYLQPWPEGGKGVRPMSEHGYALLTPKATFQVMGADADSASQIRELYIKSNDADRDRIIADLYGEADANLRDIFDRRLAAGEQVREMMECARTVGITEQQLDWLSRARDMEQDVLAETVFVNSAEGPQLVPDGGMGTWSPEALRSNLERKFRSMADMARDGNWKNLLHVLYSAGVVENMLRALLDYERFLERQGRRPVARGREIDITSDYLEEKWSERYKRSINCDRPQGFSQKAHCAGRKK